MDYIADTAREFINTETNNKVIFLKSRIIFSTWQNIKDRLDGSYTKNPKFIQPGKLQKILIKS